MPAGTNIFSVHCRGDGLDAKMTAVALEGLVNQTSAEAYVDLATLNHDQLALAGRPYTELRLPRGNDRGLRVLFEKYQDRVKEMIVYDPAKDWTWYLAVMAAAQQNGIPVTETNAALLKAEFGWKGTTEDFRNRWFNRIQAYNWAITNLLPNCSKKVVFTVKYGYPVFDYVVATKGFVFWLDPDKDPMQKTELEKIYHMGGYGVGTSLMGYAGDSANITANKYGIGYVVSDWYANGSFWSSFPNKTYKQPTRGRAVTAVPGKVYVAINWSDGDNVQIDQIGTFVLWQDAARGSVPTATTMSPTLQELNPPLLDWYYTHMTTNDELMAGPGGVQFIYGKNFNDSLFPAWCKLNREWIADAGFSSACLWHTDYPSQKYTTYTALCGLAGIFKGGSDVTNRYEGSTPILAEGGAVWSEAELYERLAGTKISDKAPVFVGVKCIVGNFVKGDDGFARVQRAVARVNAAYPGRFVFMLPKDLFATFRKYYHLPDNP